LDIISVNSIIAKEEKNTKPLFVFEFTLNVAHLDTIVVKQKDRDLYSAIDIAADRVSKVLRRHHDKISGHKAVKLTEVEASLEEDAIYSQLEKLENEIIPVKLASFKTIRRFI
jgi:putative sigma-54 modulation protein